MSDSRGACPICTRVMQVRLDGLMRDHRTGIGGEPCRGVGRRPLVAQPHGTVVYRCFDRAGRLLYIGCTQALADRMWHHATAKPELMRHLHRTDVTHYPERQTALRAERAAIRAEAPLLNQQHNLGRGVDVVPPLDADEAAA